MYVFFGILAGITGTIQIIFSSLYIFVVIPRISALYKEFSAPPTTSNTPFLLAGLMFFTGVLGLLFTSKLLSKNKELQRKYLPYAIVYIAVTFILAGAAAFYMQISTLQFIYNLSETPTF